MTNSRRWRSAAQVRLRYGGCSDMWIWRRLKGLVPSGEPRFPKPVYMAGRRFWDEAELDAYDEAIARQSAERTSAAEAAA